MRKHILLAGLLLAAACAVRPAGPPVEVASDTTAPSGPATSDAAARAGDAADPGLADTVYGPDWYVSDGWPGEYPPGFSILEDNVVLMGHATMDPDSPAEIACPVPALATYQPWNTARVDADGLAFVTATRMYEITMTANAPIAVPSGALEGGMVQLPLRAGDVLTYKRYLGEGWAIISFAGRDYEINEAELINISNINSTDQAIGSGEDLWVEVTCSDTDATRAWLLHDEAMAHDAVGPTPVIGYGEARDLTPEDLVNARLLKEMQAIDAYPEG